MRSFHTEYILKGIYLGLVLFVALEVSATAEPDWMGPVKATLCTLGGLAICLGIAAGLKLREGYRASGQWPAFILFLLLECPTLVYAGVLLGTVVGAILVKSAVPRENNWHIAYTVGGGAILGAVFGALQSVTQRWPRLLLSLGLAAGLVGGLLYCFGYQGEALGMVINIQPQLQIQNTTIFGAQILFGIPLFYLLTFSGQQEESEVEIGAICAALGFGALMLMQSWEGRKLFQSLPFLLPVLLYFWYTMRVLPGLRVFKYILRGLSYLRVGRLRLSLLSFRKALKYDPNNKLAQEHFWKLHLNLDPDQLSKDPETLALVDFNLCLQRVGTLLMDSPTPERMQEAVRLLELIVSQKPAFEPAVDYWRAVADTHSRNYEKAAASLERLLDPACYGHENPNRRNMLLPAWQMSLLLSRELKQRVGDQQLTLPGRRMEVIGAVERALRETPNEESAWTMKRMLYQDLTEEEFAAACVRPTAPDMPPVVDFDYEYVAQLGLALIGDPVRWQRGAEYLRMAACGLPMQATSLFVQIAQACQRAGDGAGAWKHYDLAKQAGRAVGPKNLPDEERQTYFGAVKLMAQAAQAHGDVDTAIENYQLYTEYERAGVETLRSLAGLLEQKGDALAALRVTDRALVYDGTDKDLLEKKDKYYYSVAPEDLQARLESFKTGFDVDYCLTKARSLLDNRSADLDLIDWAQHLLQLASVIQPERLTTRMLLARSLQRRGEKEEATKLLEAVRTPKPEKFASAEEEESWFTSCRLLGELYLDQSKPELAVQCFLDYKKSPKSGADTLYKLGQAYEQLGDHPKALKYYEHVVAYEGHPLAPDARDAMYRLQSS